MAPAEDVPPDVIPAPEQVAHRFLRFVRHVDRGQFARAEQPDQLGGVPPVRLDPLSGPPRSQRRRDYLAGDVERPDLPIQVIPRHPRLVARRHRALPLQPFEQAADVVRIVRQLPHLGLHRVRSQDPGDDLPLAVIERHVCSTLLHDRPPFACGSVPLRNNPRLLCDTVGRSFHMV